MVGHDQVAIHQVPAVSTLDRTILIIRDDGDSFYTADIDTTEVDCGHVQWWETPAAVRRHHADLAAELGPGSSMDLEVEVQLWATVATIIEQATS